MKDKFSFSRVPTISARRSSFDLSRDFKFTMNVGKLYPVGRPYEVYPGDTFKIRSSFVVRSSNAFLKPVMDRLYLEVYHFFVPHRIVYNHDIGNQTGTPANTSYWNFQSVMGENRQSAWVAPQSALIPTLPSFTCSSGTVADYLEFPLGANPAGLQALPFRGFAKIYDEWYRDQNNTDPMYVLTAYRSSSSSIVNEAAPNNNAWGPNNYTGQLPNVTKAPDYFTRALQSPQKGGSVDFLAGASVLPVLTSSSRIVTGAHPALEFGTVNSPYGNVENPGVIALNANNTNGLAFGAGTSGDLPSGAYEGIYPDNLYASLSSAGVTINDLRTAMALQRLLEKDAVGGTRYKEILASHWGVKSSDARLDDTELIGGKVLPLTIQQVPVTSAAGSGATALGSLGAYSWSDGQAYMNKGFTEHGYIFTCACIKQKHTYSQGIPKQYMRTQRSDFYDPVFANLGMLPVYKEEIYASGISTIKNTVFGYQEAWSDLKMSTSGVAGQMRPNATTNFEQYSYADEFANAPTLNQSFVEEGPENVDRTLAVPSSTADQFIVDFHYNTIAYRELPVYSNPSKVGGLNV